MGLQYSEEPNQQTAFTCGWVDNPRQRAVHCSAGKSRRDSASSLTCRFTDTCTYAE
jgi:hypothetical protein